jgi:ABC-2 type transport system permease protein
MAGVFSTVLRKEFRELYRDGRFFWCTVLLTVLLTAAFLDGWQRYQEAGRSATEMQQAERERWLNQGNRNPHSAAHQGLVVFRPQLPTATVDPGIDPYVGRAVHLEAHSQRLFGFRPAEDSSPARRLGELTAAVTLQQIIPLFIIILAFNAFSGERESGTLRLLLSTAVEPSKIGWSKAAGLTLPLLLWLVPITTVAVAMLFFSSDMSVGVSLPSRFLIACGAYLAYFVAFLAITLGVSALASSSRQALIALLLCWFVNSLLLPPVIIDLARRAHPSPTALDLAAALREGKIRLPIWYEQLGSVEKRLLQQYGASDLNELPISANGVAMVEEEDDFNRVQDEHFGNLYRAHQQQNIFYKSAGFLTPLVALQPLSMALASSDFEQHADFALAAETYRREMTQAMNRDSAVNELERNMTPFKFSTLIDKMYQPGRELWEKVPPFEYQFFPLNRILQNSWLSLTYLLGWAIASVLFAGWAVRRLGLT